MSRTSTVLLPNTGDTMSATGTPVRVDGRHRFTVAIHTANLTGTVLIEGTLEASPSENDWFPVIEPLHYPHPTDRRTTQAYGETFVGSFTYLRARLVREAAGSISPAQLGSVDRVLLNA